MRMSKLPALGMIETVGVTGLIAAADVAAKAANVRVVTRQGVDAGIVTVFVVGDVASVQAAVQAGEAEATRVGRCRGSHVIPRPGIDVLRQVGYLPPEGDGRDGPAAGRPAAGPEAPGTKPPAVPGGPGPKAEGGPDGRVSNPAAEPRESSSGSASETSGRAEEPKRPRAKPASSGEGGDENA